VLVSACTAKNFKFKSILASAPHRITMYNLYKKPEVTKLCLTVQTMVLAETGSGLSFFFSFAEDAAETGLAVQTQITVTAHGLLSLSFFFAAVETTITATAAACVKHKQIKNTHSVLSGCLTFNYSKSSM